MKSGIELLDPGGVSVRRLRRRMAALPYFSVGPWSLGPITIYSFGVMVAIGVMLAHAVAVKRAVRLGLGEQTMRSLLGWMLVVGFVGSHVFNVLMYEPQVVLEDPLRLLWIPGSLSSFGGILGALIGVVVWKKRHPKVRPLPYLDAAAFALPVGWLFGRIGCALVHDHPGALTDFFLAVDFGPHAPGGIRHDLGLYEALWWVVLVGLVFGIDRLKPALRSPPGFYLALLPLAYTPVRFGLDFLRVPPQLGGDVRYFGLTPAQYLSIVFFLLGLLLMLRWRRSRTLVPVVGDGPRAPPYD